MLQIIDLQDAGALLARNTSRLDEALRVARPIVADVRQRGDEALLGYARQFDGLDGTTLGIPTAGTLHPELLAAVEVAARNIREFAEQQLPKNRMTTTRDGRIVGQVVRPLDSVGVYVPAGRYPLLSTLMMAVIPAQVAGVTSITVACPRPSAEMLALAAWLGIGSMLRVGGAHAIAALAYGTETISRVERIVGPGNAFVAAAKKLVVGDTGIDFVAGPSEIVVVAEQADPRWIAADMLAQCEHDCDASALLLTTSRQLARDVQGEVERQLTDLPTRDVAQLSIDTNSAAVVCPSIDEALSFVNALAPEHLSLHDATWLDRVNNAGSIFLGPYSTEAAGDYASGPNHVLPTSGVASLRGGLSSADFVKVISVQELSKQALCNLGPVVTVLARAEGLEAHARSVEVRTNA